MHITIFNEPLSLYIHGLSGTALNNNYSTTAFQLMNSMWQKVRDNQLKNKGLNIWLYDTNEVVFTGVELNEEPDKRIGLEAKQIDLKRYAYYKHIGPYHLIKQTGQRMRDELKAKGIITCLPYIEIYGHWANDETKLETELLMSIQ